MCGRARLYVRACTCAHRPHVPAGTRLGRPRVYLCIRDRVYAYMLALRPHHVRVWHAYMPMSRSYTYTHHTCYMHTCSPAHLRTRVITRLCTCPCPPYASRSNTASYIGIMCMRTPIVTYVRTRLMREYASARMSIHMQARAFITLRMHTRERLCTYVYTC